LERFLKIILVQSHFWNWSDEVEIISNRKLLCYGELLQ